MGIFLMPQERERERGGTRRITTVKAPTQAMNTFWSRSQQFLSSQFAIAALCLNGTDEKSIQLSRKRWCFCVAFVWWVGKVREKKERNDKCLFLCCGYRMGLLCLMLRLQLQRVKSMDQSTYFSVQKWLINSGKNRFHERVQKLRGNLYTTFISK